jgi:hypothetical protein
MKFRNNFNFKQITFYLLERASLKGYKGNFNNLNKDYTISSSDNGNNVIFYPIH